MNYLYEYISKEKICAYAKYTAAFGFFLLVFFVFPANVKAIIPPDDVCAGVPPQANWKKAIFAITGSNVSYDFEHDPTVVQEWVCKNVAGTGVNLTNLLSGTNLITQNPGVADAPGKALGEGLVSHQIENIDTQGIANELTITFERGMDARYFDSRTRQTREEYKRFYYILEGANNSRVYFIGIAGEEVALDTAVAWTVENQVQRKVYIKLPHGENRTVQISAQSAHNGQRLALSCEKCSTDPNASNGALFPRVEGADGSIENASFVIDSRKLVDTFRPVRKKNALVGDQNAYEDLTFVIKGASGSIVPRVSTFEVIVQIGTSDCDGFATDALCSANARCFWWDTKGQCKNKRDTTFCSELPENLCGKGGAELCLWQFGGTAEARCVQPVEAETINKYKVEKPEDRGLLPECALSGSCRNINTLIEVMIEYGKMVFQIVGALAFVMFIYGGFMMIFSMGSPERVKKGRDILVAAVVGLIIVFGAYVLVSFLLDALSVKEEFRLIN